ncbi:hypothetical protein [Vreelandella alkaliphila]|uniref:hypothetical protein n=1 Tax=Vreelandella alkaliphila TaxID=272774 RepID=UPI00197AACE2|nr:hypothetical protein [Halomonas alkaliphila]
MPAIDRIQDEFTQTFATACYDDNSPSELRDALANGADETDMKTWGIDEGQWIEAVNAALIDLEEDQGDAYKLHEIGQALFGVSWQSDMARALGIKDARKIRFWVSGERAVPTGVWDDLKRITKERGQRLLELSESL